jgi:hypothetical protein
MSLEAPARPNRSRGIFLVPRRHHLAARCDPGGRTVSMNLGTEIGFDK